MRNHVTIIRFFCLLFLLSVFSSPAAAGYIERDVKIGGYTRSYLMYRPATPAENMPVLIAWHGRFGNPERFDQQTLLAEFANRGDFILLLPKSNGDIWRDGLTAPNTIENDIVFTDKILDEILESENVDRTRIFAAGMSGGGFMAQSYACRGKYALAGMAVVAAAMHVERGKYCKAAPLDVVYVHGDKDNVILREGGIYKNARYYGTEDSVRYWVSLNGCTQKSSITARGADVKEKTSVVRTTYSSCADGRKVTYYDMVGAGHTWPGSLYKYGGDTGVISRAINMTAVIAAMIEGR